MDYQIQFRSNRRVKTETIRDDNYYDASQRIQKIYGITPADIISIKEFAPSNREKNNRVMAQSMRGKLRSMPSKNYGVNAM